MAFSTLNRIRVPGVNGASPNDIWADHKIGRNGTKPCYYCGDNPNPSRPDPAAEPKACEQKQNAETK
jgi:hypothetical protein